MTGPPAPLVRCDHTVGCVTCGDEAEPMRVLSVDEATGLAACRAPDGTVVEVEVELIAPVAPDDAVLVHAGVAIQALDQDELAV